MITLLMSGMMFLGDRARKLEKMASHLHPEVEFWGLVIHYSIGSQPTHLNKSNQTVGS